MSSGVIKAELMLDKGIFVISQYNGVITFMSMQKCEIISFLNSNEWGMHIGTYMT